jgi:predicted transcriptional regulator
MTVRAKYLRIPPEKWGTYQHYQKKVDDPAYRPRWLKLYLKMLDTYPFRDLTPDTKWCYIGLLLIAAEKGNLIPSGSLGLSKRLAMSEESVTSSVHVLLDIGMIERYSEVSSRADLALLYPPSKEGRDKREEEAFQRKLGDAAETALADINKKLRGTA